MWRIRSERMNGILPTENLLGSVWFWKDFLVTGEFNSFTFKTWKSIFSQLLSWSGRGAQRSVNTSFVSKTWTQLNFLMQTGWEFTFSFLNFFNLAWLPLPVVAWNSCPKSRNDYINIEEIKHCVFKCMALVPFLSENKDLVHIFNSMLKILNTKIPPDNIVLIFKSLFWYD